MCAWHAGELAEEQGPSVVMFNVLSPRRKKTGLPQGGGQSKSTSHFVFSFPFRTSFS